MDDARQVVTVPAGKSFLDLGTIPLNADVVAKMQGKTPPEWVVSAARGAKAEVKLADQKGKWVYIEFWGHWCHPCVAGSLPELIAICEKNAAIREKFEVFAIHADDVKSFAELDAKLPALKERHWKGKDLPFPILLDATGETAKLFGIKGFPTGILIDPAGKVVGKMPPAGLEFNLRSNSTKGDAASAAPKK